MTTARDLRHAFELLNRASGILARHRHFDSYMKYWPQIKLVITRLDDVEEGLEQVILNVKKDQSKVTR